MLVIDPGTMRLPLRSAGEQCSPLHALYSFCIIPKSNPVLQGIFCLGVMFVQLDLSCRRRRRWRWAVPLVLAALLLALPQLAALRPAALARVDRVVGRHYMTRLNALQQENFTLHQQLAQSADALAENAALRQLVGCGRDVYKRQAQHHQHRHADAAAVGVFAVGHGITSVKNGFVCQER